MLLLKIKIRIMKLWIKIINVKNTREIFINQKIFFENENGKKDRKKKYDISNIIINCNNEIRNGIDEN